MPEKAGARAALGITPGEFASLLADILGWTMMLETVGRWEACLGAPPRNVVMFARACLAGAR